ncbi:hypothetical protein ACGFIK_14900 [Micromonospora sp. NPDC048871]|uniref:hypothetical protein n=1 Tax=unclassified Micromonospora TaxID=2617518 RepID=UPI002E1229AB|nr:hypothetical protein OIE53_10770 [Micromonospora sp. NBC_01739]
MNTKLIELFALVVILLACGAIYLAAGPAALAAVTAVGTSLFATWRGTRGRKPRGGKQR